MKANPVFPRFMTIVIVAGVYFAAAKLGLTLAFVNASATPVWPPTGIALAALLVLGYRIGPGILIGAFLANITTAGSIATSIGIAVGNTLEGLVAAWLVNRFAHGRNVFDRTQDIFKFVFLAALGSPVLSATIGVTSLSLGGYARWIDFGPIWLTWWLGDAVGDLIVAPVLILWATSPGLGWNRGRLFEAVLLFVFTIVLALVVFGGLSPISSRNIPLEFLIIPVLVWGAFRFGQRGAATFALIVSGVAIWGTLNGSGPFVRYSQNESLILLQSFMGIIAITGIGLAAVVSERQRMEDALRVAHSELERRVEERTMSLSGAVEALKAEVAARIRAQDLYDTLLKAQSDLGDGVALTEGMRFIYANEALARIYGFSVDELMELPSMLDIIAPEERLRLMQRLRERQSGANVGASGETVLIHKDGHRVNVEYAVKMLRFDDRLQLFSIIRDISERKKAAEALRASEEKFKGLLESAPDAMVIVDGEGQIRIVNSQTEKLFGYGRDELYGQSVETLIPERFRSRHLVHRAAYLVNPQVRTMGADLELLGLTKDEREFPVDISLSPLNTAEGVLVTAAIRDITERKRAEETLREQAALLDLAHDAIIVRGLDSRIVFWSYGAEQTYGWTREQAAGKITHALLQTQFPDSSEELDTALLREGQWNGELVHFRSDGTRIVVASRQVLQRDKQGRPAAILEINSDITARKYGELRLQASSSRLRALASRLESVREEERTRIARELHDELGQALTALKFDLATLAGRLPKRNQGLRADAQAMSNQIDTTIKLVRRISTELRPGMLDDLGLAAAIEWQGQEFAARTGIECRVRLPEQELVSSREQATAIFRIFQETLTNVARHAKATKVEVDLELVGEATRLRVRDNGQGFDNAEVKGKHSLGLLGMEERAEILGGTFEVESAIGQGTTVTVVIPLQGTPTSIRAR